MKISFTNATVHNFADGNTFSAFAKTVLNLVELLLNESEDAVKWFCGKNGCKLTVSLQG